MTIGRRIFAWLSQVMAMHETLDLTDYIAHLERAFGITLAPDDTAHLYNLRDMTALVLRKLVANGRPSPETPTWTTVRRITSYEMGVREADLTPETRFVEDLCC